MATETELIPTQTEVPLTELYKRLLWEKKHYWKVSRSSRWSTPSEIDLMEASRARD